MQNYLTSLLSIFRCHWYYEASVEEVMKNDSFPDIGDEMQISDKDKVTLVDPASMTLIAIGLPALCLGTALLPSIAIVAYTFQILLLLKNSNGKKKYDKKTLKRTRTTSGKVNLDTSFPTD